MLLKAISGERCAPRNFVHLVTLRGTRVSPHCVPCPQPAITCSKLAIETLEQGVKYVQN